MSTVESYFDLYSIEFCKLLIYGYYHIECGKTMIEDIFYFLMQFLCLSNKYTLSKMEHSVLLELTAFTNKPLKELFFSGYYDGFSFVYNAWKTVYDFPNKLENYKWFNIHSIKNKTLQHSLWLIVNWCWLMRTGLFQDHTQKKIYILSLMALALKKHSKKADNMTMNILTKKINQ